MSACMGGFCPIRDRCASYEYGRAYAEPSERLCAYGNEKPSQIIRGMRIVSDRTAERKQKAGVGGD